MRIAFIVNSRVRHLKKFRKQFSNCGHPLIRQSKCFYTEYAGHAVKLSFEHSSNYQILVAVGGDGTLHEVINGIMQAKIGSLSVPPAVALLPYGSANDFARQRKLSTSLDDLLQLIDSGSIQNIDVGRIEKNDKNEDQYFINIADAGFGAEVVHRLNNFHGFYRRFPSGLKFMWAMTRAFLSYRKHHVKITMDQSEWSGPILSVIVANSSSFGSGLKIAPDADISDGMFEIVILGNVSFIDYMLNLLRVKKGRKIQHNDVHYLKSVNVGFEGITPIPVEADGEVAGSTPVKMVCLPGALQLYCP